MIILHQENIKLIQILECQVKDILMKRLKNIVICGEKGGQFSTEKYNSRNDLENKTSKIKQI